MNDVYGSVALAEIAVMPPLLFRLAVGPTISDRIVAVNTITAQATLAVLFYAAFADRAFYLDLAIWLASFSYVGTIVWSRYLARGLL
jgi:multicomponent Na+:H+ antiporter subunit F